MNFSITPVGDPELDIPVRDVDLVSFIDHNTHGKGATFGLVTDNAGKRVLIINSANIIAAEVDL